MLKIESIIRIEKLEDIKKVLSKLGVKGMTVTEVEGVGKQRAEAMYYRGQQFTIELLPKIKIEVVIADSMKEVVVEEIINISKTGHVGDGKIFISPVSEVYRIRTGETGENAL